MIAEMEGKIGTGILPSIFKFFEAIKSKLKANAVIREEIKTEFAPRISDLIEQIDAIADLIQSEWHLPILVVIDDLDKLDLANAETIFCNNIKPLFQPNFRIIYTIPEVAHVDLKLRNTVLDENSRIFHLRASHLFSPTDIQPSNPRINQDTLGIFLKVLSCRIPDELISPETARDIVLNSGGVIREVIRLADLCCATCLVSIRREIKTRGNTPTSNPIRINDRVLGEVLADGQLEWAEPLGQFDYDLLVGVNRDRIPKNITDPRFQKLWSLGYILAYRELERLWYSLHPLALKLLKTQGYFA